MLAYGQIIYHLWTCLLITERKGDRMNNFQLYSQSMNVLFSICFSFSISETMTTLMCVLIEIVVLPCHLVGILFVLPVSERNSYSLLLICRGILYYWTLWKKFYSLLLWWRMRPQIKNIESRSSCHGAVVNESD